MDASNNQKIRKPIVEKRRRARINKSLAKLLDFLVLNDVCPQPSRVHKYDKADILEMTVDYLKLDKFQPIIFHSHRQGFNHCLNETVSTLKSLKICDTVIDDLTTMLQNKINHFYEECCCNSKGAKQQRSMHLHTVQDKENTPPQHSQRHDESEDPQQVWRPW